jgi:hypothetical protein
MRASVEIVLITVRAHIDNAYLESRPDKEATGKFIAGVKAYPGIKSLYVIG